MYKFFYYIFLTVAYIPVQDDLPTISIMYGCYFIWQPLVVASHHIQYNKWADRKWWLLVVTESSVLYIMTSHFLAVTLLLFQMMAFREDIILCRYIMSFLCKKNHRISNYTIWYDMIWCISGIWVYITCSKQHGGMISKLFWSPNLFVTGRVTKIQIFELLKSGTHELTGNKCWFSTPTMVTQTRHDVTSYLHSICC
jgi:hypothetical protein